VDGGAVLVLADFRLIEYALSALDPSKWAILQRPEMKGTSVYHRLLTPLPSCETRSASMLCADVWWDVLLRGWLVAGGRVCVVLVSPPSFYGGHYVRRASNSSHVGSILCRPQQRIHVVYQTSAIKACALPPMSRGNIRGRGAARVRSSGCQSCSFPVRLAVLATGVLPSNLEARLLGDV
jgi:hypothetical protein